ncbi:hypothetical protein MRX96_010406 [Rhipicephalus microplus]
MVMQPLGAASYFGSSECMKSYLSRLVLSGHGVAARVPAPGRRAANTGRRLRIGAEANQHTAKGRVMGSRGTEHSGWRCRATAPKQPKRNHCDDSRVS